MTKKPKYKIDSTKRKYQLIDSPFYKLTTKRKLASLLGVSLAELSTAKKDDGNYAVFEERGKSGKPRVIQHPKDNQRRVHFKVASLLSRIDLPAYLHSGKKRHSHVTNANAHVGSKKLLATDIKAFFKSTTRKMVFDFFYGTLKCSSDVADALSYVCTYNSHIPTGSQLSMPLAFWANVKMFEQLYKLSCKHGACMTLYVDDLTFSGALVNRHFTSIVKKIIASHNHIAHPDKTKLFGVDDIKVVTGVAIKNDKTFITNKQHKLIYQSFEYWKGCRDEPLISDLIKPKLLGRLNSLSVIDPKLKDKARSVMTYKEPSDS
jgi:hypothetical protein